MKQLDIWFFTAAILNLCILGSVAQANEHYAIKADNKYTVQTVIFDDRYAVTHQLAVHRWANGNTNLLFMAHGYADDCGYGKPIQNWALAHQLDVVCLDLPGHGLSSGARADISSMLVYEDAFKAVFPIIAEMPYQRRYFLGHSTGNVGMLEMLLNHEPIPFDEVIMATPLVRSKHWGLTRVLDAAFGWAIETTPRGEVAKGEVYDEIAAQDKNRIEKIPMTWLDALIQWNKQLKRDQRRSDTNIHVIFAESDSVIDTKYNKKFIDTHFSNASFTEIAESDHMVFFEKEHPRKMFFQTLGEIVSAKK